MAFGLIWRIRLSMFRQFYVRSFVVKFLFVFREIGFG